MFACRDSGPSTTNHKTDRSLLLQHGENVVYVKEQLRYSSISITVDTASYQIPAGSRVPDPGVPRAINCDVEAGGE
jgi:hypothetical protein